METPIVDLAGQSAAATSKAKKPAIDIFGNVLAKFLDRIGAGTDGADAAEREFFQATQRAPRERAPEVAEVPPADQPRARQEYRDESPAPAVAAVEAQRDAETDRAAIVRTGADGADSKFHPDATAASRLPSSVAEAGAAARVPTIVPPKDAPPVAASSAPPANHQSNAPAGNGGAPPIQVKVTEAPVQAQAATALGGRAAVVAQDASGEPPRPAPTAHAAPQAVAATQGDAGKGGANTGSNGNSPHQGFAGLPQGIAIANAAAAQPPAALAANASFAQALEDGAIDPMPGERVLSAGLPAQAATTAAAAAARRAAQSHATPQLPRLSAMEQIAINIQKAVAQGKDAVTIQLRPEELGRIDVRMEVGKDGQVTAQIRADRPETLELLQRDVRGLERALQDAGLRADSGALSFGLRGDNGANGRPDDTGPSNAAFADGDTGADEADSALPAILRAADGRIDLHV